MSTITKTEAARLFNEIGLSIALYDGAVNAHDAHLHVREAFAHVTDIAAEAASALLKASGMDAYEQLRTVLGSIDYVTGKLEELELVGGHTH